MTAETIPSLPLERRTLLKGLAVSALALGGGSVLSACTGAKQPTAGASASVSKTTTLGSSGSDAAPKKAIAAMVEAFQTKSGDTVKINTVPHNDFQNNINSYLQGSPDDAFTWFAGYRMRYYAAKDLVAPVDDVWSTIGGNFSDSIAKASTGDDGKKYFVPIYNYPWGFFYRKSVWEAKGYTEPATFDELKTLCAKMKADGLIPIAFADKDGWPAMGTFDYLNMRLNGYQFHVDLCAHKESWDQQKVKDVFDNWKSILPFQDPAALGATWQEAATGLGAKKSGMYLLGSFVTQQFSDKATLADIDFFPFPEMAVEGRDAVEAPIDGYMLSKKGGDNQAAKDLLAYIGSADGENVYYANDPSNLPVAKGADLSKLTTLNKKCADVIANAKSISQFFDRDALPAMANNVMIPALQGFVKSGTIDTANLEKQAKSLYASQ
ncbi:ABC transporter substrate-binding protein [uncultured Friedmanniella sp.]|uniref:ABC transporter substrate-binding protein n=1 Tax=uncultured Friedmanniella sp. TaxID=335381 RepID=UPI0035C9BC24